MNRAVYVLAFVCCTSMPASHTCSQPTSVNPGINDSFRDPDVQEFMGRFEVESRELFARRHEIVEACQVTRGQTVADIGAGTGLFTRLFSDVVGADGRVIAVEISPSFLDHIATTSEKAGHRNVETLLATADSTRLPPGSVDVAFICDTYHHFEFPLKTMASIRRGLKPNGRVIVVDFHRIPGTSSDWVMNHVRAGQEVFEAEIKKSGFKKTHEETQLLRENYFVVFQKSAQAESAPIPRPVGERAAAANDKRERKWTFEDAGVGTLPPGLTPALTGDGGPVKWQVVDAEGAPSGAHVVAQLSGDRTNARYPLLVFDDFLAKDMDVSIRFKLVSGRVDQAAGIVWRLTDTDNYFVVRANALENNVVAYKTVAGKRASIGIKGNPSAYGVNVEVPANKWSTLRVRAVGPDFEVFLNDKKVMDGENDTFMEAGKIGIWTKADSVTQYDDLTAKSLDPR